MSKYIAFTIGPIYRTFQNFRHTREVWAASYFFSYIARGLILKLIDSKIKISEQVDFDRQIEPYADKFILPNIDSAELFANTSPVGLFPDNIIVGASILGIEPTIASLNSFIHQVIGELSEEIAKDIGWEAEEVQDFLLYYLRIIPQILEVENPILGITPILNCLELEPYFISQVKRSPLMPFFKTINKRGHFMPKRSIPRFESIIEIATQELSAYSFYNRLKNKYLWDGSDDKDSDGEFVLDLMKHCLLEDGENIFKTYHKYIAIVKADGDKIGATLKGIEGHENIKKFSQKLLRWGLESKRILEEHGAKTIFIGGDDLLFFAPVATGGSTVFDLVEKLNEAFSSQSWFDINSKVSPTLSFGISIAYYKSPLIESLDRANDLLYAAKQSGGNSMATQLLKHSGSELPLVLHHEKHSALFKAIGDAMKGEVAERAFINAVSYKIRENEVVLGSIIDDADRVKSFFVNILEEEPDDARHKLKDKYLTALRDFLLFEYKDSGSLSLSVKQLYSVIRIVKFVKGLEDLKD